MFKAADIVVREPFSKQCGRLMGEALIEKLGGFPSICWLFTTPTEDLENMVRGVAESIGNRLLIGCTSDGEVSSTGYSSHSAVLAGILTDRITFEVGIMEDISRNDESAGKDLARQLSSSTRYVQLFSDGLTGNGSAVLRGMASVLGSGIPISGGTAADNGKFVRTYQFLGNRVLTNAAAAVGFSGDFSLGTGIRSGWTAIGLSKIVTRASGNKLYELNGESAVKVYERFLGKHAENLPEVGVEYPLLIQRQSRKEADDPLCLFRATMSVDREEGSITFAGDIPEGSTVFLTCGDKESILKAASKAAHLALQDLGNARPAIVFCYSCMARKKVLARRIREEVIRIRKVIGNDIPLVGFYTYGEYGRLISGGPSHLHNETVTLSVIGV